MISLLSPSDGLTLDLETHKSPTIPVLNGLVLAGGKSSRMGVDKGLINWHGKEQRYYMADMLMNFCADVFISRSSVEQHISSLYKPLTDTFIGMGPYGAILTALKEQREAAWLVVACDLPLVGMETLQQLVTARNPSAIATAFKNETDDSPEPLITIWEPQSYLALLSFLDQGCTSARTVLKESNVHLLTVSNPGTLTNVNTPEDMVRIKSVLNQQQPE